MIAIVCCLAISFHSPIDTTRLPRGPMELPETNERNVMPNARPSFHSRMPVYRPDESKVIPMPNSGSRLKLFQIPREKRFFPDSSRQKY